MNNKPIQRKVDEIADVLFQCIEKQQINDDLGLLSGKFGILLFLAYYINDNTSDSRRKQYENFCNGCLEELVSKIIPHTYCYGLSGIFACLRVMNQTKILEVDYSEVEQGFEKYIYNCMLGEFELSHYDVLHGALGDVLYYHNSPDFAEKAINWLEDNAVEEKNGALKWMSEIDSETNEKGYNICLSHGISSILYVLCRIHYANISPERTEHLISGTVSYILSQELNPDTHGCHFPSQSIENSTRFIKKSRLAWCYGDLGIASSLWFAGKTLDKQEWKDKAIEVMTFSASRKDLDDCSVVDAGLCHGSAGIAMMFYYMHTQTNEQLFWDASNYWIDATLKMAQFKDGYAGFKTYSYITEGNYINEVSLLEGVAGIGLMLLTISKQSEVNDKWLELFMLS